MSGEDSLPVLPVRVELSPDVKRGGKAWRSDATASTGSTSEISSPAKVQSLPSPELAEAIRWYARPHSKAVDAFRQFAGCGVQELAEALLVPATQKGKRSIPEVESVVTRLRRAKVVTEASMPGYLFLARQYAVKGRFEAAESLAVELQAANVDNAPMLSLLFELAVRNGKVDVAVNYLEKTIRAGGKAHKVSVSLLLKKLRQPRGLDLVEKYVQQHIEEADEVLFNSFLDACARLHEAPRLERVLRLMRESGVGLSAATYGTLLKAYGSRGDFASVQTTWQELCQCKVVINAITFGCMLDATVRCKQFVIAEEIWSELVDSGVQRNNILYCTMIKAHAATRSLDKALAMKAQMQLEGVEINCVTYNSLIDVAMRCKDWQVATSLLSEMRAAGVPADLITYSTLIKGLCDMGCFSDAVHVLAHLEKEGLKPDDILFNSLLEGCVKSGASEEIAVGLLRGMQKRGIPLSNITFSVAVKLFITVHEDLAGALELVHSMMPAFGVQPSQAVFTSLVTALVQKGYHVEAATALLTLPQNFGLWPRPQQVQLVLPGLVSSAPLEMACDLLFAAGASKERLRSPVFAPWAPLLVAKSQDQGMVEVCNLALDAAAKAGLISRSQVRSLATGAPVGAVREFVPGQMWLGNPETAVEKNEPAAIERETTGENAQPNVRAAKNVR